MHDIQYTQGYILICYIGNKFNYGIYPRSHFDMAWRSLHNIHGYVLI